MAFGSLTYDVGQYYMHERTSSDENKINICGMMHILEASVYTEEEGKECSFTSDCGLKGCLAPGESRAVVLILATH